MPTRATRRSKRVQPEETPVPKRLPTRGVLAWIRVDRLQALRRNPQYLTPHQLEALVASMRRDDFLAPTLVRPMNGGRFEILSGNHRVIAARNAGLRTIPCLVKSVSDADAKRIAVNLNTIHGDPTAELLAPFLAELPDDLLQTVHLSDDLIEEVLAFDQTLKQRLEDLTPPPSLDRDSDKSRVPDCKCPTCGRVHASL